MSKLRPELDQQVLSWLSQDPDSSDRNTLAELHNKARSGDAEAVKTLELWFSDSLRFGTAGLRGPMRPGPGGMNRVVVSHAAFGLGEYLLQQAHNRIPHVVIGFDSRRNSELFASDSAALLAGQGIRVSLFDKATPTPVLAFTLRHLDADAAIMVTASHNPANDNGYKVFLGGGDRGSQIVSPTDAHILDYIRRSHSTARANGMTRSPAQVQTVGEEMIGAYVDATVSALMPYTLSSPPDLHVCYTPLHGVGRDTAVRVFQRLGITRITVVNAQAEPDPTFPTVAYPNPEEPGTLDLAFETANAHRCDIVIAHDPDADRLAVALPDPREERGWQMLSGNELGALLLSTVAEHARASGQSGTLAESLVSSPIILSIARANALDHCQTPTGFKWISRAPDLIAGFEEALGYLVTPQVVSDKDGISAGALAALIAQQKIAQGGSLNDLIGEVMARYGAFSSDQVTLRFSTAQAGEETMAHVRQELDEFSRALGATETRDFLEAPGRFPPSNIIEFTTANGDRIIVRPSGTEPKLKVYLDALGSTPEDARSRVRNLRNAVTEAFAPLMTAAAL